MKYPAFNRLWTDNITNAIAQSPGGRLVINRSIKPSISKEKVRKAAVLVPLCNRHGIPSILFTLRTKTLPTHKGQVSFPGGHLEGRETAVKAALREVEEELGDGVGDIRILGVCQDVPAITGTLVTPVIGFIEDDVGNFERLVPSHEEVERIFTRSLEDLETPGYRRLETLTRDGQSYEFPTFGQSEERIWGFTAVVLDAVLAKAVYPTVTSTPEFSLKFW